MKKISNPDGSYKVANNITTEYYNVNGKYHRLDGPAFAFNNNAVHYWYRDGLLHRQDGPAIEYMMMPSFNEWWYNGNKIHCDSLEEFIQLLKLKAFW